MILLVLQVPLVVLICLHLILLVPISPASRTSGASVALFYSYLVPISSASRTNGASVALFYLKNKIPLLSRRVHIKKNEKNGGKTQKNVVNR